ncbi:putative dipeptidase PepE [Candidatus Entotheonellaceae bacterium PAL068K]
MTSLPDLVACCQIVFDAIRPGARSADVYGQGLAKFSEVGYNPISFVRYGIGLHRHEVSYLGRYGDWPLAAGMVLGVEPLLYLPGHFGLQIKDRVAVTERGCELLSNIMDADRLCVVP